MKKNKIIISLILVIFLFTFSANIVYAAEKTKCEGDCEITNICACELPTAIKLIYEWVIRIGIALAFLMVMYGGVKWMMAGGSSERVGDAKSQIGAAIIGIVLLLTSFIILQTINPRLISLELPQLPEIERIRLEKRIQALEECEKLTGGNGCCVIGEYEGGNDCTLVTEAACCGWRGQYLGEGQCPSNSGCMTGPISECKCLTQSERRDGNWEPKDDRYCGQDCPYVEPSGPFTDCYCSFPDY